MMRYLAADAVMARRCSGDCAAATGGAGRHVPRAQRRITAQNGRPGKSVTSAPYSKRMVAARSSSDSSSSSSAGILRWLREATSCQSCLRIRAENSSRNAVVKFSCAAGRQNMTVPSRRPARTSSADIFIRFTIAQTPPHPLGNIVSAASHNEIVCGGIIGRSLTSA